MDIEKVKTKLNKDKLTGLTKEISKETRNLGKLKTKLSKTSDPDEREKLENYISTLENKTNLILSAMTKDKIDGANLASLSKCLRTITDRSVVAQGGLTKKTETKKVSINVNIENLGKDELLELLNKKSQHYN